MFAVLPVSVVETLASHTRVEIIVDGVSRKHQADGEFFGEIALLRDLPRSATVRATTRTQVLAVDRAEFLGAIGSHALSRREIEDVAEQRRPRLG